MKVNEKSLIKYAGTPPFDLEGWLTKKSSTNSWRRRYCLLKNNLLFYFDKRGVTEPVGLIFLENCTVELADEIDGLSFHIVFDKDNLYTFAADNQCLMEGWMKSLASASYEYKKAMVLELQRQLNDISNNSQTSITEAQDFQPTSLHMNQPTFSTLPRPPSRRQNPFNRAAPLIPTITSFQSFDYNNKNIVLAPENSNNLLRKNNQVNANKNALVYNWETFGEILNNELNQSTSNKQTTMLNHNSEYIFETIHERFKRVILDDMNQYRIKKGNLIKPLIIF